MELLISNSTSKFEKKLFAARSKTHNKCFIFASLISIMVYVFAFTGGDFKLLVAAHVLFSLWVIYNLIFKLAEMRFSGYGITVWWFLSLVLVGNIWVNHGNYSEGTTRFEFAAAHVAGIIIFALAAQWAARNLNPEKILEFLAWMLLPLAIFAIYSTWGTVGRADPRGIHPNWWGEMAFGLSLCALATKKKYFQMVCLIIALFLMYRVQSRGAMFSSVASAFTYWILRFRPFGKTELKRLIIALVSIVSILFFLFKMHWLYPTVTFVEDRILLLHDQYRGLGIAFSGRAYSLEESINIFLEKPLFGNGFDTLSEVHNGFLRFAAEGGILLFGIILVMILAAMLRAWRQRNNLVFAILLGMIVYFMTYPRALNLNIAGVIFLLSLFPWRGKTTCVTLPVTY